MKKRVLIYLSATCLLVFSMWSCHDKSMAVNEPSSCCSTKPAVPITEFTLPDMSVYHLDGHWNDHYGRQIELKEFAGKPVVLTMFFTHCEYACPLLVHDIKGVEALLGNMKDQFTFVLVSFDDKRGTPECLKLYAESQGVGENWIFLHGPASQVKELSVIQCINYEELANGQFAHSNRKLLLDPNGVVIFQQDGLQTKAEPMVNALKPLL